MQHRLGVFREPEDAVPFHAQVDDPTHCRLDGSAPDGTGIRTEVGVSHSVTVDFEVPQSFRDGRAAPPDTKRLDEFDDGVDLAGTQGLVCFA